MVQQPTNQQMVRDVVQALAAFAKMRVLHSEVLRVFTQMPAAAWQEMSSEMVVEAIASYAQFQIEDVEFNQFLADLIVTRNWDKLRDFQLVNLAFAAATLELGNPKIYNCFQAAFRQVNAKLGFPTMESGHQLYQSGLFARLLFPSQFYVPFFWDACSGLFSQVWCLKKLTGVHMTSTGKCAQSLNVFDVPQSVQKFHPARTYAS